jgi:phosphopantetheinyl transferase (holo-ACP synthase)
VIKIAVDLLDIRALEAALARTPRLFEKLFHQNESQYPIQTLCASICAKECLIKVGILNSFKQFSQVQFLHDDSGAPYLECLDDKLKSTIGKIQVSISHTREVCVCVLMINI